MLLDLTILLLCQLAGETIAYWTRLPVPGPVIGLVLLAAFISWRGRAPGALETTASTLLSHLSLLFVPAGVGVMLYGGRIADEWPAILVAVVLSTWLAMAVTGLTMSWLARRMGLDAETQP